jgi:hypothetical protein
MPTAPPTSAPVSEIAEAAPARSCGADPTISSVVTENSGARARETTTETAISTAKPEVTVTSSRPERARAATTRHALRTDAGRKRRMTPGARLELTTNPMADGSDHRPASRGDSPCTSCMCCATNRR